MASYDAKLIKQTKFPPEFSRKVDVKKVNVEVMKKYATCPDFTALLLFSVGP